MSLQRFALLLLTTAMLHLEFAAPAFAQTDEPAEPAAHEQLWTSVAELLRRREYGAADNLLEFSADDPELSDDAAQLAADRDVVIALQNVETMVATEARKLPEGSALPVGGTEYRLLRVEEGDEGHLLVVTSAESPREKSLRLRDLPAETWLTLAEAPLASLSRRHLVLGAFLAFDRFADAKAARARFDEAARDGEDVRLWLARLEEAERLRQERRAPQTGEDEDADDLLLGRWRMVTGKGRGQRKANVEFQARGRMRGGGSWEKEAAGRYRITNANGGVVVVRLSGNLFWGETTSGRRVRGIRQTGS